MLDRLLNPSPTIYKWDRFWVGFVPALLLPVVSFFALYGFMAISSVVTKHESFAFEAYMSAMRSSLYFLRIATLCCMPSAGIFFFLVNKNYNNASRAVVITTMLYVMLIVIKDVS